MKSKSDYAEMYKSRTEEIKVVLRKNDQKTRDYKLYNEAVFRATKEKNSDILVARWAYEMLACLCLILIPSLVIGYFVGYDYIFGKIVTGGGIMTFFAIVGIRGLMLSSVIFSLEDYLTLGNPYINGKIPNTRNFYLRKYIDEYKAKTQEVFNELKKDEEKALDAIEYDNATGDSIEEIKQFRPLIMTGILATMLLSLLVFCDVVLPSGYIETIGIVSTAVAAIFSLSILLGEYVPTRTDIRIRIKSVNPYRTDK